MYGVLLHVWFGPLHGWTRVGVQVAVQVLLLGCAMVACFQSMIPSSGWCSVQALMYAACCMLLGLHMQCVQGSWCSMCSSMRASMHVALGNTTSAALHITYSCANACLSYGLVLTNMIFWFWTILPQVTAVMINRLDSLGFNWPTDKAAQWQLHEMFTGEWGASQIDT